MEFVEVMGHFMAESIASQMLTFQVLCGKLTAAFLQVYDIKVATTY